LAIIKAQLLPEDQERFSLLLKQLPPLAVELASESISLDLLDNLPTKKG